MFQLKLNCRSQKHDISLGLSCVFLVLLALFVYRANGLASQFTVDAIGTVAAGRSREALAQVMDVRRFANPVGAVDQSGRADWSGALSRAINAANTFTYYSKTHDPQPACVYLPAGNYYINGPIPEFSGAGCVLGDGSSQTLITLGPSFHGNLFSWEEAWSLFSTLGPRVKGIRIQGNMASSGQNALMFFDRNDYIYLEDIYISDMPGRAIGTGLLKPEGSAGQSYIRESHFSSINVWRSGTEALPAVEFATQGSGPEDGTNEISVSMLDIYGSRGISLAIRNSSSLGTIRGLKFDNLRIEGAENGAVSADLLAIGGSSVSGVITLLSFTSLELIDPYKGYSAISINSSGRPGSGPSRIYIQGFIGGGLARGNGLAIRNGSNIHAIFSLILTSGTNIIVGPSVEHICIDGNGAENTWSYEIDPSSVGSVTVPAYTSVSPARLKPTDSLRP